MPANYRDAQPNGGPPVQWHGLSASRRPHSPQNYVSAASSFSIS